MNLFITLVDLTTNRLKNILNTIDHVMRYVIVRVLNFEKTSLSE